MATIENELPPKVRPGFHTVMLDSFQTALMFQGKAPKLICYFTIVSTGDFGKRVPRFYNVKRIIGNPSKGGRFQAAATGDLAREFYSLTGYGGNRLDRLPMTLMNGLTIQAEIETVTHARGRAIPEPLQYSKVARLIKVVQE